MFAFFALNAGASPAWAQQVCVEEAGGVCLKYAPAPEPTPAAPKPQPTTRAPAPLSPAAQEERALRLTRDERREVQAGLRVGGYYNGSLDGAIGRGTRAGISRWQSEVGEPVTGFLTFAQARRLRDIGLGREEVAPTPVLQPQPVPQPAPSPQPEPEPVIAAPQPPDPPEPKAPDRPARGSEYRKTAGANSPEVHGDGMTVQIRTLRRDEDTAEIRFRLSDGNQYNFSHSCLVPVAAPFQCDFYGPNRNKNSWSISGEFPEVQVVNGWINFNRTWELWKD
ncbi:MAG: peptidoglycan-binding domain-containing protein [Pseudomonadota bacterium]